MHLRGLDVRVTDSDGNPLREWGIQRLRPREGAHKISAYVQSETGVQFQISVQPRIPFIDCDEQDLQSPDRRPRAGSEGLQEDSRQPTERGFHSSPMRGRERQRGPPKFSFLVSLYLDGRSDPERRIIAYIDPADPNFHGPSGKLTLKSRFISSRDGSVSEHAWIFKEKAIETILSRLVLSASQSASEQTDTDDITTALERSGVTVGGDHCQEEQSKAGQIVVEMRRVIITGPESYDHRYPFAHKEGQDDDIDMDGGVHDSITHKAGFICKRMIPLRHVRVVDFKDYIPGEANWATFQFFYRGAGMLLPSVLQKWLYMIVSSSCPLLSKKVFMDFSRYLFSA